MSLNSLLSTHKICVESKLVTLFPFIMFFFLILIHGYTYIHTHTLKKILNILLLNINNVVITMESGRSPYQCQTPFSLFHFFFPFSPYIVILNAYTHTYTHTYTQKFGFYIFITTQKLRIPYSYVHH